MLQFNFIYKQIDFYYFYRKQGSHNYLQKY